LIAKIHTYTPDYTLEELEGTDTERLKYLSRLLEAHSAIEKRDVAGGRSIHSWRRGDELPKLTDVDEEILDRVWAQLADGNRTE